MKKKWSIGIALSVIWLLAGCGGDSQDSSVIETQEYQLPIPEHAEMNAFYYKDDMIYYVVGYASYYEQQIMEAGKEIAFADTLNTEIRSYDVRTGKDALIYRYDASRPIEISDILCGDGQVYWEEIGRDGYLLWSMPLESGEDFDTPKLLLDASGTEQAADSGLLISPRFYKGSLYWYEPQEDGFALRKYENGQITTYDESVYLASPYQYPLMADGCYAYAQKQEDGFKIVSKMEGKKDKEIPCELSDVGVIYSGTGFLAWTDGYYNDYLIQVYDRQKKSCETLDLDYYFSAGLIGEWLLLDTQQEMLMYHLPDMEITQTWSGKYQFILQNDDGDLFCENASTGGIFVAKRVKDF